MTSRGLTLTAYARHRKAKGLIGGTKSAVHKAIKTGRIPVDENGLIDPAAADKAWALNTTPRAGSQAAAAANGSTNDAAAAQEKSDAARTANAASQADYLEARSRKEWALASKRELELAQARGELVSVVYMRDQVTRITTTVAEAHNNIPGTWLARLEACRDTAERRTVLETGVEQIKAELMALGESITTELDASDDTPDRDQNVA